MKILAKEETVSEYLLGRQGQKSISMLSQDHAMLPIGVFLAPIWLIVLGGGDLEFYVCRAREAFKDDFRGFNKDTIMPFIWTVPCSQFCTHLLRFFHLLFISTWPNHVYINIWRLALLSFLYPLHSILQYLEKHEFENWRKISYDWTLQSETSDPTHLQFLLVIKRILVIWGLLIMWKLLVKLPNRIQIFAMRYVERSEYCSYLPACFHPDKHLPPPYIFEVWVAGTLIVNHLQQMLQGDPGGFW